MSNCTIYDTRLAGIALEIVDGGLLEGVVVSGITMNGVGAPVFIRLGDRGRPFKQGDPRPGVGKLRNVVISDIEATGAGPVGCALAGLPGAPIENVTLDNLRLVFSGGGTRQDAEREVPEFPEKYPEYKMFGTLPAYAFYCRHARNLALRNISTEFVSVEERPAVLTRDVENPNRALSFP